MRSANISSLLVAVQRNRGYDLEVSKVSKHGELVYITMDEPKRTVVMTREAYSKISDFIKERGKRK